MKFVGQFGLILCMLLKMNYFFEIWVMIFVMSCYYAVGSETYNYIVSIN
jgi:hypothetical protein